MRFLDQVTDFMIENGHETMLKQFQGIVLDLAEYLRVRNDRYTRTDMVCLQTYTSAYPPNSGAVASGSAEPSNLPTPSKPTARHGQSSDLRVPDARPPGRRGVTRVMSKKFINGITRL